MYIRQVKSKTEKSFKITVLLKSDCDSEDFITWVNPDSVIIRKDLRSIIVAYSFLDELNIETKASKTLPYDIIEYVEYTYDVDSDIYFKMTFSDGNFLLPDGDDNLENTSRAIILY